MALEQTDFGWTSMSEARVKEGLDTGRSESMTFTVAFRRLPRARCQSCGVRRVLFTIEVVGLVQGRAVCAKCMGLRG